MQLLKQPTFSPDSQGNGEGIAAFLLTINSAKGDIVEKGYRLDLTDLPDMDDRGGMNAAGVRAFDITVLTDEQREELNLADPSALEGAGLSAINAQVVTEDPEEEGEEPVEVPGRAVLDIPVEDEPVLTELPENATREEAAAQPKRQIVILVPYSAPALAHQDDGTNPDATNPDLVDATNQLLATGLPADAGQAADPTYDVTALQATLTAFVNAELLQEELVAEEGEDNALEEEDTVITVALPSQMLRFTYVAPADKPQAPEQGDQPSGGDSGYYGGIDFDHLTAFTLEGLEKYATQLELWVPYLYFNEKGGLTSTYYYNVWADPNKTEADHSYPDSYYSYLNEDATFMSITLDTDLNTDWWVYLKYNEAGDMIALDDYFISQGGPEGMALADCKWGLSRVWVPDGRLQPNDTGVTAYTDGTEVVPGQLFSYKGKVYRIADLQTKGFTGCLVLKYKGRQAEINGEVGYNYQMPVGCAVPSFVMNMNGAIPENAGGSIIYGGQTYNYSKGKDVYLPGGKLKNAYTIPMTGDPGTFGLRKITFLKTNLEFETTYTKMSDNVLYDRYNYMVYKVTTKNTSPLGSTASIDFVDYALRAMNTESNNMEGMLKEDHAAWLYDKTTGKITKVDNPSEAISSANSAFVGVPNQGGVLIYNVTGWTDDQWDSLDMAKFGNIDEVLKGFLDPKPTEDLTTKEGRTAYLKRVGAPISQKAGESDTDFASRQNNLITGIRADGMRPIPYATRGQSGTIAFIQREDRVDYRNARYGYLVPAVGLDADGNPVSGTGGGSGSGEGDEGETKPGWVTKDESASEVSFLVAIPYTTNISLTAGKDGRAYYVTLQSNMTARFGGLGDNDYSWGANQTPFPESFKEPTVGMDFSKYAIEKEPGQTTETLRTTTTESYVGYPSTFLTNGIATTGNVPLYGEEAAWFRYKDAQLGADNQPLRDDDGHILYKTDSNGDPIYVTVRDSSDVPSWATAEIVDPTAGPLLEESLPEYFKLMNLEILIDPNNVEEDLGEGYLNPDLVNLGTYYDIHPEDFPKILTNEPDTKLPEGVVVQFEVEEPLGADQYKTYWVTAGKPESVYTADVTDENGAPSCTTATPWSR